MEKLKCIIIDDEEGAHLVITHYIEKIKMMSLVGSFYNAVDALDYIYKNKVDIVFLDINMPGLSGLEMLETLSIRPNIVLTTAYKKFALEGYKYEVVDYLVKPFDFKKFISAVDKVINRINLQKSDLIEEVIDYLVLKINGDYIKISFADIKYLQSYGNYVKVFTNERMFLTQITTAEIEEKLDKNIFMRIHKSYIISLKKIDKISGKQIFMNGDVVLPIGNTFKRELINLFK